MAAWIDNQTTAKHPLKPSRPALDLADSKLERTLTPSFLARSLFSSKLTLATTICGFSSHILLSFGYKPLQLAHHGAKKSRITSLSELASSIAVCMAKSSLHNVCPELCRRDVRSSIVAVL